MNISPDMDPDIAYFRDIERAFVERRGDPLFISNADWVFLARLRKKGVPARVVLRGITDAFDAHAHSFSRKQKIRSMKFCETEIVAAAERYRRAHQAEGPGRRGLSAAIEKIAAQIGTLAPPPEMADSLAGARQSLLDLAASLETERDLDAGKALAAIENRLVGAAHRALGPAELAGLEEATRHATAAYKSRMPGNVYETLIGESLRRKVLQRFNLPRLLLAEIE